MCAPSRTISSLLRRNGDSTLGDGDGIEIVDYASLAFNSTRKLTTDFGSTVDTANALWIGPDYKITAAGTASNDFAVARFEVSSGLEERTYLISDANHNITSSVDVFGSIRERYLYTPYGERHVIDGDWSGDDDGQSDIALEHGFQGKEYDPATGFNYFNNRWYDPVTGRFLSADPIGYPDGASGYQAMLGSTC